ncbi:MAG TPA: hypothetical protein VK278_09395 [Gaiellaceae bacterium]|nr:hypothetical protein [Gaiellaceae bacterium]
MDLAPVLWIGGGQGSGKSSLAKAPLEEYEGLVAAALPYRVHA